MCGKFKTEPTLEPFMDMGLELFKQIGSLLRTVQAAKDDSLLDGAMHELPPVRDLAAIPPLETDGTICPCWRG
jgi:hypothetical protein